MRFDVLTLFPELFEQHTKHGVTRRAFESKQVDVRLWPLRDFGAGPHQRVDDRPFGGGPGMVMQAPVLQAAVAAMRADRQATREQAPLILFTPAGQPLSQAMVRELAEGDGALLLCGRYEGIDQRFIDREVDLPISLGDFVLSGGEIPALALLDAVARLQTGVLGDPASHQQDSFAADGATAGLLDCPHYTQPADWDGTPVPAVLASGHHGHIARWRREQSLTQTARLRPDVLAAARAQGLLSQADEVFLAALGGHV
jgi:tRNA (guanine37-N1)-methyltransferase